MWQFFRWLYSAVFTCLLPYIFFRLWIRGLRLPSYRRRWAERLGCVPLPPLAEVLWIQAVSVGEAISTIPLIHRIRLAYPDTPILITTTTPTGSERVQAAFKDGLGKQIYHCYMPYDLPWTLNRFFQRIKPRLLILMETELWPNLLHACYERQLPVIVANGRLSPGSAQRYGWLGHFRQAMIKPIHAVAAQSPMDAERFKALGIDAQTIWQTGNIKFDLELPSYLHEAGTELRQELGVERQVWIAASTHEGEETIVLRVYAALKAHYPQLLLLLVPRHPDRFNKIANLCNEQGFKIIRRSHRQACTAATDIFLGDTMGELPLFYAASDVVFVGGSLVPIGGHNLLEPAALGLPLLTGPELFNFVAISELLLAAKGVTIVNDEQALQHNLAQLLSNSELRKQQGHCAKQVVEKNRGAIDRLLKLIDQFWSKAAIITV